MSKIENSRAILFFDSKDKLFQIKAFSLVTAIATRDHLNLYGDESVCALDHKGGCGTRRYSEFWTTAEEAKARGQELVKANAEPFADDSTLRFADDGLSFTTSLDDGTVILKSGVLLRESSVWVREKDLPEGAEVLRTHESA